MEIFLKKKVIAKKLHWEMPTVLLFALLVNFSHAFAARGEVAPVIELNKPLQQDTMLNQGLEIDQDDSIPTRPNVNHLNESVEQRLLRVERQISNLTEMNVASKLEKMQLEMQKLQGQMEVQQHELAQLNDQMKNFYQDLDQRLGKFQPNQSATSEKASIKAEDHSKSKGTGPTAATSDKTKELQTYEVAFNQLNKKDYNKAITSFQSFLRDYPTSAYSVNAHYWLGEIYYLKGMPDEASKEFHIIIANYSGNSKVADAMLKIALIEMDAGNYTKAKQSLQKVQKQFPGTTAAKIAALRLKEIKQRL